MTWAVIERCGGQIRVGFGGPYALDYVGFLMMAQAMGAPTALLADVLPSIEPIVIQAYRQEAENAD